ncbi:MAG: hypothetical protein UHD64_10895 [Bacteroidales bacterium]|nr:hypothetical protein [Bacteroidales bacterium]
MVRGTTAQFKFSLPYNFEDIDVVDVVFWQPGNSGTTESPLPIHKTRFQCQGIEGTKELSVTLSPSETLRFSEKSKAKTQLRAKTKSGICFASKQELITVYPSYDDSIVGDVVLPTPDEGDDWVILDGEAIG